MPYNTSTIPRPEEVTGTSSLPLARVKKIIAQDDDIAQCSNGAAFAISVATEEFLRYLTEQALNVAKSENKPRRNIAYKDVAAAVSKFDNLQFLSDTVPKTMTYRQFREKKAHDDAAAAQESVAAQINGTSNDAGQRSIASMIQPQVNGSGYVEPQQQVPRQSHSMANSPIVDRTVLPNGHVHPPGGGGYDVEMRG